MVSASMCHLLHQDGGRGVIRGSPLSLGGLLIVAMATSNYSWHARIELLMRCDDFIFEWHVLPTSPTASSPVSTPMFRLCFGFMEWTMCGSRSRLVREKAPPEGHPRLRTPPLVEVMEFRGRF